MRKKIVKVLIVMMVLLCLCCILYEVAKKNIHPENKMQGVYIDPNYVAEKSLKYNNLSVLAMYKGEMPISTVSKKVRDIFLEKIPDIINDIDDAKLYYNNNKNLIRNNLHINNIDSFVSMVNKINGIGCNIKDDYNVCEFTKVDDNTIKIRFEYLNGQFIECNMLGNTISNFILDFNI